MHGARRSLRKFADVGLEIVGSDPNLAAEPDTVELASL
jgi:hypothetical protein